MSINRYLNRAARVSIHSVCMACTALSPISQALAQQIVIDGRTKTTVNVNGSVSDVHTQTVHGKNSYNSFKKFDVHSGSTVNIHIPGQAQNSINLVHGKQTQIDGTLNSVKDGKVGGNLYILNSHGVVVGPTGRVNTGAFNAQTPTREFMEGVLGPDGTPDAARATQITDAPDTVPLSANGVIKVRGKVNAVRSVELHGGSVNISGEVNVGNAGRNAIRQAVNLDGIEELGSAPARVKVRSSRETRVSGRIDASGSAGRKGGTVELRSVGKVHVAGGARIDAAGRGAQSDGGTVLIYAEETATFDKDAVIDVSGGATGNGGFVDFSAFGKVELAGGTFLAGAAQGERGLVVIDPETVVVSNDTVVSADLVVLAWKEVVVKPGEGSPTVELKAVDGAGIYIGAPRIAIEKGAILTTEKGTAETRGDVTLLAVAANLTNGDYADRASYEAAVGDYGTSGKISDLSKLAATSYGSVERKAEIVVDGATISGNNVTLRAGAAAESVLFGPSSNDPDIDEAEVFDVSTLTNFAQVFGITAPLGINMIVSIAKAEARIDVKGEAVILADKALTLDADATASATPNFKQYENAFRFTGQSSTAGLNLGGMFAWGESKASVNVGSAATLSVGQAAPSADSALKVSADSSTKVSASAEYIVTGDRPVAMALTVAFGNSDAAVNIAEGTKVRSTLKTDIDVTALAVGEYSAVTKVSALRTEDQEQGGGVGVMVTYADFDAHADASFGGVNDQRADGRVVGKSLDITAKSDMQKASFDAEGKISDDPKHYDQQYMDANASTFGQALLSPVLEKISGAASGVMSKIGSVFDTVSIVGAVAIGDIDQSAKARLTRGVLIDGDITVDAQAYNKHIANFAKVEGKGQKINLGFALALPLAMVKAVADAAIAPDEDETYAGPFHVDASGAILVDATVDFPGPQDTGFSGLAEPFKQNDKKPGTSAIENLEFLDPVWNSNLYKFIAGNSKFENAVEKLFFNSRGWATTEAKWEEDGDKAKTLSMAINTTIALFDNSANARVAGIVEINRHGDELTVVDPAKQTVSVKADSFIEYLSLTGDASLKGPVSGASGSTSLGVAFSLLDIKNTAVAQIGSGAKVEAAGDITVEADTEQRAVTIGFSAGWGGGDVGINGAVGINFVEGTAKALVGDPDAETAVAGTEIVSTAGAVAVTANDTMGVINLIGGVSQANNVGVSAGVAFNDVSSTSVAALDRVHIVSAHEALDVSATNDGFTVGAALSAQIKLPELKEWASKWKGHLETVRVGFNNIHTGLFATDDLLFTKFVRAANDGGAAMADSNATGTGSDTAGGAKSGGAQSNPLAKAISDATGKFGINVSADATVNVVSSKVDASITGYDATSRVEAGHIDMDAESALQAIAIAGSVTVKKPDAGNTAGAAGLAGSYSHNGFDENTISARIANVGTVETGNVDVTAHNKQQAWGFAAGGSAQAGSAGSETANIAGSVSFNTIVGTTTAEIADSRIVRKTDASQAITVKAEDDSLIASLTGSAVYSQADTKVGVGAAGTANILETDTVARLSNVTIDDADTVDVIADSTRTVAAVALGVGVSTGGSSALSAAVSVAYNNIAGDIVAEMVGGKVDADALKVEATDRSVAGVGAGDVAVTTSSDNTVTAGVAIAVNNLGNSARATISGAELNVLESIKVNAELSRLAVAVAAGVAATKGDVAIKGSVAVNLAGATEGQTLGAFASIDGRGEKASDINGSGTTTVAVTAKDETDIHGYAGAVAAGKGAAGIGAGLVVNKIGVAVDSFIGKVTIDDVTAIDLTSYTDTDIISVAASVGASEKVAVSGAIVVNVFQGSSTARVGSAARIGETGTVGHVVVGAGNNSTVASAAGSGAFAKEGAGIGGALTVDVYSKTTTAAFDGFARLDGSLSVLALADDNAYGGLAAFGVGSQGVGFAGAVGVVVANNNTTAVIGSDATETEDTKADVYARGNVIVDAYGSSDVIRANLAGGIGKSAGVGALVSVEYLGATTTAEIANGAKVTGLGHGSAAQVRTGEVGYDGLNLSASSSGDNVTEDGERIKDTITGAAEGMKNGDDFAENDVDSLFAAHLSKNEVRGVSVTADSDARMINLGLALGISENAGVGIGATATASTTRTVARIGSGAQINWIDDLDTAAHTGQDVNLRAGSTVLSVSGSVGVGAAGKVGVGGGVDVSVGNRTTHALIDDKAKVRARDLVAVAATSDDISVSVGVGIGAAGNVGVGGAVTVGVSDSETVAEIGDEVTVEADAVHVKADAEATRFQVTGSGGFSGTVGVGASVSVLVDSNRTFAKIGGNSTIKAKREVIVDALSSAAYRSFTVAAGGAGTVGVAASVAVKVLRSNTQAVVGDGTRITVSDKNSEGDSVVVSADSTFDLLAVTGGGGVGGKVGVGAGIDVMVGRATTVARVGSRAEIEGAGDIVVKAEADKTVNSTAVALGGGAFAGVAGAVNVMMFGEALSAAERAQISGDGPDQISAVDAHVNGDLLTRSLFGDALDVDADARDAGDKTQNLLSSASTSSELSTTAPDFGQTQALIDRDAVIRSGGDVEVTATDVTKVNVRSGGLGVGIAGVGMGAAVSKVRNTTVAAIGDGATVLTDGSVKVKASDGVGGYNDVLAFTGAAGGFAGNVAIAIAETIADAEARIGADVTIARWHGTVDAYDPEFRFVFTAGQKVKLKAQGMTDAEIEAEEKRRTLAYHLVHEELIGLEKGEKPDGVTQEDFDLYWAMRQRGTAAGENAAYDPDYAPALTGQGDGAMEAEILGLAASLAESAVAGQEKAIENAVKGHNTSANQGAALPNQSDRNVQGVYDPDNQDPDYQRYWTERGVVRKEVVTGYEKDDKGNDIPDKPIRQTLWVATKNFPSNYVYTFPDRTDRIADETASRQATIAADAGNTLGGLAGIYKDVHARLADHYAQKNGGAVYDPAAAIGATEAAYWNARNVDVSAVSVEVGAVEANSVKAEAYGGSIGGAAIGGQVAVAKKSGTLVSQIADAASAATGAQVVARTVSVTAVQSGSAEARAVGGNAGTFAAAGGVVAVAENTTDTTARVGDHALLRTAGDVTVRATSTPRVRADAIGVNVSGGFSLGVSSATTRLSNTVLTEIGDGVHIASGGHVAVEAINAVPGGQDSASARAVSGGGGLLIGASAAIALNTVTSTADAKLGSGVTLDISDVDGFDPRNFTLLADSATSAGIEATGIGVGYVGIGAVVAKNDITNTSRATVGSGLEGSVSGTLRIASEAEERADISAVSGSGGVVAGAAAVVENTLRNTTSTTFANGEAGAGILVGRLQIDALHDRAYAKARSNSGRASLVGYSGAWVDTDFVSDVDILVGSGFRAGASEAIAVTARNVIEKAQDERTISAGSGGLFDMSSARSETTLDNSVDIAFRGAELTGFGGAGLTANAINNVIIADTVNLDAGGAIAVATSESRVVNAGDGRDHARITVGDGAKLTTEQGSISLATRTEGDIDIRASSKTYGGAGGAGAIANAYYTVENAIDIDGGSVLQAGLDLSLKAGGGSLSVDTEAYAYNKTLIPIVTNPNVDTWVKAHNSVEIDDAEVTALRDVAIDTRGGSLHSRGYGEAEDWTKALKAIFENIGRFFTGQKPKPLKEIRTAGSTQNDSSVHLGRDALVQAGVRNVQELKIALENGVYVDKSAYAGTPRAVSFSVEKDVNVSQQLRDEIAALTQALAIEGDADKREILRGEIETLAFQLNEQLLANGGNDLVSDVITVDDIAVDTGDVNIWTSKLTGEGAVKTSKKLEIRVDNESSAAMRMGDLEVRSTRNGEVRLNGKAISSHASVDVRIEGAGPEGRLIDVRNSFESADGSIVQPDLYLDGKAINRAGTIKVGSTGSLIINNDVEGQTVELLAQEAIIQRYRLGFSHVGGLPYVDGSSGSMIAGGNVFLAGQYLNINGTVQAGIPIRELKLDAAMQSTIDAYDEIYRLYREYTAGNLTEAQYRAQTAGYGHDLADDLLAGTEAATSVKLTSFLDPGQPIVAAYNLETREIEVQRTETGGGLVTLYGHIISTGNGQIKVTDGFGDLQIENGVERDLVLYGLDTGQGIEGKVKIVDTAYKAAATGTDPAVLARVTEITRDADGRVVTLTGDRIEVQQADGSYAADTVWNDPTTGGDPSRTSQYDPKAGQTYHWLRMTEEGAPECEQLGAACSVDVPIGGFFGQLLRALGLPGTITYTGTDALDASRTIGVEFIGADIGRISVDSARDIHLVGDVVNTTGQTSIVSRDGSIIRRGEATIGAADLTLKAANGAIGGADATGLWLDMVEGTGLLREASAANGIVLSERSGSLRFETIDAGEGDAVVTATDSLVGLAGNVIAGRSVTLAATGGSIGSQDQRVNVDTGADEGVFNATAFDDIHLAETDGDLRIERIRAGGLVDLDVDGNVLDANTLNENSGLTQEEREKRWAEAGLIGDAAEESLDNAVQSLKDKNEREYDDYWKARGLTTQEVDNGDGTFTTVYSANEYDPGYAFRFTEEERADMLAANVSAASIARMEIERTAAYHAVHDGIGEPADASAYDPNYAYSVTGAEMADLQEGYLWTVDELSGSINKALFSDRTDTDPFIEDPNIVASELRLKAGGAIGEQRGVFELELPPEGQDIDEARQAELFDALAQAERDDVIYIYQNAAGQRYELVGEPSSEGDTLVAIRVELKEDVDADISGAVEIVAGGDVFLGSEETDINIYRAESATGNVRLKSRQGLTNARLDEEAAVIGGNVVLEAATGSIGSETKRILVDVRNALSARAAGSIHVRQVSGDLSVDFVRAGDVADILVSAGALLDARGDVLTNIRARTVNLDALSIGEAGEGRGFGVGQLGDSAAVLNAVARGGDIYIEGTEEDLFVGRLELEEDDAGTPQVLSVDVLGGGLLKGLGTGLNIVANGTAMTTLLKAAYGIGVGQALDVRLHALAAENRLGLGIRIAEVDDLVLLSAVNHAAGETVEIVASDNLAIDKDGVVSASNGTIRLIAASDGNGGDVTQDKGAGAIDAGALGSVFVRGENIRLENVARAREARFETLRAGHSVAVSKMELGRAASFTGGTIDVGMIAHTGGPELLDLEFVDHDRPVERLDLGLESAHGVVFRPLRVMDAVIDARTSRTVLPDLWVGRTARIATNETTVTVDQLSPAIVDTGVQIHQRPNLPFQLDLDAYHFRTDAKIVKFDRETLTAVIISERPVSQFTDTAFDATARTAVDATLGALKTLSVKALDETDLSALYGPVLVPSPQAEEGRDAALSCDNPLAAAVALDDICDR